MYVESDNRANSNVFSCTPLEAVIAAAICSVSQNYRERVIGEIRHEQ
jgi:hypothetical protein